METCKWCEWFTDDIEDWNNTPNNGPLCDCGQALVFHLSDHPHQTFKYDAKRDGFDRICDGFQTVILEQVIL